MRDIKAAEQVEIKLWRVHVIAEQPIDVWAYSEMDAQSKAIKEVQRDVQMGWDQLVWSALLPPSAPPEG